MRNKVALRISGAFAGGAFAGDNRVCYFIDDEKPDARIYELVLAGGSHLKDDKQFEKIVAGTEWN